MSKQLPIIVKFEIEQEHLELVKSELLKILEPTRKEEGCMLYELHEDIENPNILMFYEVWETKEHWMVHDKQEHIEVFRKAVAGKIKKTTFNKLRVL